MARVAFVTGGTRGIGRAIVQRLSEDGVRVAAGYSGNDEAAQATARATGCFVVKGNVGSFEDCARAVQEVEAELGPVDILVNNAGIPGGMRPLEDLDEAAIDAMFAVTVKGAMLCTQAVLPGMKLRRGGRIINTASITAYGTHRNVSAYAAAKGAIISLTRAWAREFAEWNILVNAVAPGRVQTPMSAELSASPEYAREVQLRVPLGRRAQPEEIASVVAFLASADADYMTGQILGPNGGEVM